MNIFSCRSFNSKRCLCVTVPTDTPTYGKGVSKSTILKNTGIFDDGSIKVQKVKIKVEILEKEMGMY